MIKAIKSFIDEHDFRGVFTIILTLSGNADEINDTALCMALSEPYVNRWGFSARDIKDRGRCVYDPGNDVKRVLIYEKKFPSLYDKKHITFYNQKFTPEVKEEVEKVRRKNRNEVGVLEL